MSGDIPSDDKDDKNGQGGKPENQGGSRISVAQAIEENLKRVYQASLTEPVPDRFIQLMAQLREKEGKS